MRAGCFLGLARWRPRASPRRCGPRPSTDCCEVGQRALDPLRPEKSYPVVGPDMNAGITALEAGLGAALAPDKGPFVGREALRRLQAGPAARRLATLVIATQGASVPTHSFEARGLRVRGGTCR